MERVRYTYEPTVIVSFTQDEVDELMQRARAHYDARCRLAAEHGGTIYGMNGDATFTEEGQKPTRQFTRREIDLLAKICESVPGEEGVSELYTDLAVILRDARAEYDRLNEGG